MLNVEQLRSLDPGDVVEMGGLFAKMTPADIAWTVQEAERESRTVLFEASYFGIFLGRWLAREDESEVLWTEVK